jgi:hypothetical protein
VAGVNAEALLVAWLKADPTVTGLVAGRVSTELPASPTYPLVTLREVTGAELVRYKNVDEARIQVDCWADTRTAAASLARAVRGVIEAAQGVSTASGFVTEARTVIRPRWLPDTITGSPKPVYSADYALVAHT